MLQRPTIRLSPFGIAIFFLSVLFITGSLYFIDGDNAGVAFFRVVCAALSIGLVPGGALYLLYERKAKETTLLSLTACSIVLSLCALGPLCFICIAFHVPVALFAWGLWVFALVGSGMVLFYRRSSTVFQVALPAEELVLFGVLAVLCFFLYQAGAVYIGFEDQIHVAVARRLMALARPGLRNLYIWPNFVYTYPFPSTHFFMALVSTVGNLDPLFLFHKLRVFSGFAALCILYRGMRTLFPPHVTYGGMLLALLLVFNGSLGTHRDLAWGQLIPISHASDIAMGVLLPALLVATFLYFESSNRREARLWAIASFCLVLTVTFAHIRETVQYIVYLALFLPVAFLLRFDEKYKKRALIGFCFAAFVLLAYGFWHSHTVPPVNKVVLGRKGELLQLARTFSWKQWLSPLTDSRFTDGVNATFYSWFPIVVILTPLLSIFCNATPLLILIQVSMLAYLFILRFSLFAVPYVYLTYFEILFTPIRNVTFFVHLLVGPLFYCAFSQLSPGRGRMGKAIALASFLVLGIGLSKWKAAELYFMRKPDVFFALAFLTSLIGLAVVFIRSRQKEASPFPDFNLFRNVSFYVAAVFLVWQTQLDGFPWKPALWSVARPQAIIPHLNKVSSHALAEFSKEVYFWQPLPRPLVEWAYRSLSTEDVLLREDRNIFIPSLLVPAYVRNWTGLLTQKELRAQLAQGASRAELEKDPSVKELLELSRTREYSYLLLEPNSYSVLKPLLAYWPEYFSQCYDNQTDWAVYRLKAF